MHRGTVNDIITTTLPNITTSLYTKLLCIGRLPDGGPQERMFRDSTPKELEIVVRERGVNTDGLTKAGVVKKLQKLNDFKYEKNRMQIYLEEKRYRCLVSL